MAENSPRYSKLAPLSIDLRVKLAIAAANFFSPVTYKKNCEIIGKTPDEKAIRPFGGMDFLKYLKEAKILDDPHQYLQRIRELLEKMAFAGILGEMGHGSGAMLPKSYYRDQELTSLQKTGLFWLAPALGDDFLYAMLAPGVVHITGITGDDDVAAGTGIVFSENYILTCAHVVNDMTLDPIQTFQGIECKIVAQHPHAADDVAVIQVDQPLAPVRGLAFFAPRIAQSVHVLGYPKIPFSRDAALTIQHGEITNESITTFEGHRLFLYSAIARPGNSGGPIISNEGYVVGITTQDLSHRDSEKPISPHYAGIASHEIARCISDLGIGVNIPFEDFN
jgi:hypothetical protein